MIGGRAHEESNFPRLVIFQSVGHYLQRVVPTHVRVGILEFIKIRIGSGLIQAFAARMLEGTTHALRIVQPLQCGLPARAGLPEVKRIVGIPFGLERATLHGTHDQPASRRAFTAGGGVIRTLTVVGVLGHFHVRLALDVARSRPAAREERSGRRPCTGQF